MVSSTRLMTIATVACAAMALTNAQPVDNSFPNGPNSMDMINNPNNPNGPWSNNNGIGNPNGLNGPTNGMWNNPNIPMNWNGINMNTRSFDGARSGNWRGDSRYGDYNDYDRRRYYNAASLSTSLTTTSVVVSLVALVGAQFV